MKIKIKWVRTLGWVKEQAVLRGCNVSPYAAQELTREKLLLLPEELRKYLLKGGTSYDVDTYYNMAAYDPYLDQIILTDTSEYICSLFTADADELPQVSQIVTMMQNAINDLNPRAQKRRTQIENEVRGYKDKLITFITRAFNLPDVSFATFDREECYKLLRNDPMDTIPGRLKDRILCENMQSVSGMSTIGEAYHEARKSVLDKISEDDARKEEENMNAVTIARNSKIDWIKTHGSSYLKHLCKEGFPYNTIYFEEKLSLCHPKWYFADDILSHGVAYGELKDPPPQGSLDLLEEARKYTNQTCTIRKIYHQQVGEPGYVVIAAGAKNTLNEGDVCHEDWVYKRVFIGGSIKTLTYAMYEGKTSVTFMASDK